MVGTQVVLRSSRVCREMRTVPQPGNQVFGDQREGNQKGRRKLRVQAVSDVQVESFQEVEGHQWYEAERSHEARRELRRLLWVSWRQRPGDCGVLKNGWGQEPVWNRGGERQGKVASEPRQVL